MTVNDRQDSEKSSSVQTVRIIQGLRKRMRLQMAEDEINSFQGLVVQLLEKWLENPGILKSEAQSKWGQEFQGKSRDSVPVPPPNLPTTTNPKEHLQNPNDPLVEVVLNITPGESQCISDLLFVLRGKSDIARESLRKNLEAFRLLTELMEEGTSGVGARNQVPGGSPNKPVSVEQLSQEASHAAENPLGPGESGGGLGERAAGDKRPPARGGKH